MELGQPREPWVTTLRAVLPQAVVALLMAVMAGAGLFHAIRALVVSEGDWARVITVPLRSAFPDELLQPAGTVIGWAGALFLVAAAGAIWVGRSAVIRARRGR